VTARPAGGRRLAFLGTAVVVTVVLAVAAAALLGGPGRQTETGIVVAVEATSLSNVEGFSIRTTDGRTVDFRIGRLENAATFPPGHLAEHKVTLVPIRVTYVVQDGADMAVLIEDAP
jgi:hypothetical protein